MAKNGFRVLDSDLHLMEPPDLYRRYIAPEYRDRAPVSRSNQPGHYADWLLAGRPIPPWRTVPQVLKMNAPLDNKMQTVMHEGWTRGFDPVSHLHAMDVEGIDVAVLFRTAASMMVSVDDQEPAFALALCRAFNDWLRDFCAEDPSRLRGAAIVPQHDPALAALEARRAVEELGAAAVVLLPMPIAGRHVHDPDFDVLWAELQRLNVPACFHGTSGAVSRDYVSTRFVGHPAERVLSHATVFPIELMLAAGSMVLGGVLQRFPNLRVAFLEGNCSWLPWWLYRLDDQWEKFGQAEDLKLDLKPSEYFLRQCFGSVDVDEYLAEDAVRRLGDDCLVISTDYPHPDSAYPHAIDEFLALQGLSPSTKRKVLWDNCARLYAL